MQSELIRDRFWRRVLAFVGYPQQKFRATFLDGVSPESFESLGIFVADSPDFYSYCKRCGEDIFVTIIQDSDGRDIYYRSCCGLKRISADSLRVWRVRFEPVINLFKEVAGIVGANSEIIPNRIWNIGRCSQQQFIYINRFDEDDLSSFIPVLSKYPKAIFVVPQLCEHERINILLKNRCVSIQEISYLDENFVVQFNLDEIESIIDLDLDQESDSKVVSRRGSRLATIERLEILLKEHYQRSRDHYFNSDHQLLPRPTQLFLASQLGVRQDMISRCLKDPNAKMLKFLWENAENIKVVLNKNF
ncbi:MAG: hypothetical protein LBB88_06795 [Planctomycetaceae bacterium]|nr:hypothetical protein [Planctomycetaceae bacterium]